MTDTPQHVKEIQLEIWLTKSPMERLRQMMIDNEAIIHFWKNTKNPNSISNIDNEQFDENTNIPNSNNLKTI